MLRKRGKIAVSRSKSCPSTVQQNGQRQGKGEGNKLADSKFNTRGATWISPDIKGNFVPKQVDHVFGYRDRIAKFIRALLISEDGEEGGGGGDENTRTWLDRFAFRREISQKRFVYRNRPRFEQFRSCVQVCGHVGSGTTLENYHPRREDTMPIPPSSTPGTWRFPRAWMSRFLHSIIFKEVRWILFKLFNTRKLSLFRLFRVNFILDPPFYSIEV